MEDREITRKDLEEALTYLKEAGTSGIIYYQGEIAPVGDIIFTELLKLGCIKSEDAGLADLAAGDSKANLSGSEMIRFIFIKDLPDTIPGMGNLEKLVQIGDEIRLGEECNAPGKIAIVEEINKTGVLAYISHPVDKDKKAYYKMPYGSFELVSSKSTKH